MTVTGGAGGVRISNLPPNFLFANNVLAFNSSGVGGPTASDQFLNNCVFGNGPAYYLETPDPTGTDGNLSVDPQLAEDRLHVLSGSPCTDAGNSLAAALADLDLDGDSRWSGPAVDIGADETPGSPAWLPLRDPFVPGTIGVTNIGGITYAWFDAVAPDDCHRLVTPPTVTSSGTQLRGRFEALASSEPCPDPTTLRYVVVLGELPPDQYLIEWSSWGGVTGPIPFASPQTWEDTIIVAPSDPGGQPAFEVLGISDVAYVVLRSIDFVEWTPIHTNIGAPFVFSPSATTPGREFYKVRISPTW